MLSPASFFDLKGLAHRDYFEAEYAWQLLGQSLKDYFKTLDLGSIKCPIRDDVSLLSDEVYIGEEVVIEPGAVIKGPVWIGKGATIRSHAYVREYSLIMEGAMVGHATETKASVLLPGAQAPHFNYVGDSLLGRDVNLGAGTILSNLKNLNEEIVLMIEGEKYDTGLRKFGAILGDGAKTGCNSVLNPGTLLGKNCIVYPLASVAKGYHPPKSILKVRQTQERGTIQ